MPEYVVLLWRQQVTPFGIRMRDLYATKDTYVSTALTRGVNLAWLSEQTGVADATLRRHYGRFIHADAADAFELSKIDPTTAIGAVCPSEGQLLEKTLYFTREIWWSRRDLNPSPNIENISKIKAFIFWNMSQCGSFWLVCPSEGQTSARAPTETFSAVP